MKNSNSEDFPLSYKNALFIEGAYDKVIEATILIQNKSVKIDWNYV